MLGRIEPLVSDYVRVMWTDIRGFAGLPSEESWMAAILRLTGK